MSKRFFGFIGRGPGHGGFWMVELLPRLRLTTGYCMGLGFAWIACWFHLWIGDMSASCNPSRQIELLPRIWLHYHSKNGAGVHLQWIRAKTHFWLWRNGEKQ